MTNPVMLLLKELKKKHIISADLEKEAQSVICDSIPFEKSDLHIRDAILGLGTILKEDLEKHYYITSVKTGVFNNVLAYAIIQRNCAKSENLKEEKPSDSEKDNSIDMIESKPEDAIEPKSVDIAVYAKEGLLKQNLAWKALGKIKQALDPKA